MKRPGIHCTAKQHWINDPNGLVFHDGLYHLYYQHNPLDATHGNMSWGHASSGDLLTWIEHPVAISYDPAEQVFSGSIVVDEVNTSGFGRDGLVPLVAIYTSVAEDDSRVPVGRQTQALAYSVDGGTTFTKFDANPVLDRESDSFRDPKVFRYECPAGGYWVMAAVEAVDRQVVFYRSDDLRSWTFLSSYGPACPVVASGSVRICSRSR